PYATAAAGTQSASRVRHCAGRQVPVVSKNIDGAVVQNGIACDRTFLFSGCFPGSRQSGGGNDFSQGLLSGLPGFSRQQKHNDSSEDTAQTNMSQASHAIDYGRHRPEGQQGKTTLCRVGGELPEGEQH